MVRIKTLREQLGWPQHRMADYLGVTQATVARIEGGRQAESGPVSRLLDQLELQISQAPQAPAEADGTGDERAACRPSPSAAGRAA